MSAIDIKKIIIDKDIKFLDFGCSTGESLLFGKAVLDGQEGLGIDINPNKIKIATARGLSVINYDIKDIPNEKVVDFTIMSHFLEHVPNFNDVIEFINKACIISKNFVFVRQPYFDADGLLFDLGLKTYYSDWRGHPNKMSSLSFYSILRDLKDKNIISGFLIGANSKIASSADTVIHPLCSPIDQHHFNSKVHPEKDQSINFDFDLFKEIVVLIFINDSTDVIEKADIDKVIFFDLV